MAGKKAFCVSLICSFVESIAACNVFAVFEPNMLLQA